MTPRKPTYVIWDDVSEDIILYYIDNNGNKAKALFANRILAKDAVASMVLNEGRTVNDLHICTIEKLENIQHE